MTSQQFIIWLKGFTEACEGLTASPKQWEKIKEVLNEVQDYDDNPGLDEEAEQWSDWYHDPKAVKLSDSVSSESLTFTSSSNPVNYSTTVWNDKMGCWHYTNYPEGFGYYFNSQDKKKKND